MRQLRFIALVLVALGMLSGCVGLGWFGKYTVSGVVVDGNDAGIEGVTLSFGQYGTVQTGADGKWQSPQLSGEVYVTPAKEGWTFAPQKVRVSKKRSDIKFVAIPLGDPYSISGTIVDENGNGLAGVTVNFSGEFESVTTDADGYWVRDGLLGSVTVTPELRAWQFEPASRTVTEEAAGVDFTGSLLPVWAKPVLEFQNADHYVTVPNHESLQLTGPLTIEVLMLTEDNNGYSTILSKGSAEYEIVADWRAGHGASLQWRSFNAPTTDTFPGFFDGYDGKWVHVAIVYETGTVYAYRDGELFGSVPMPAMQTGTSILNIGRRPWSTQKYKGQISYVRIWNVARTAGEIATNLYNLDVTGTGLVAYWRFDEGAGNAAGDSAGPNDGTIHGAVWSTVDLSQL